MRGLGTNSSQTMKVLLPWLLAFGTFLIIHYAAKLQYISCSDDASKSLKKVYGKSKKYNVPYSYFSSPLERHFIEHADQLELNRDDEFVNTCALIYNENSPIYNDLQIYFRELDDYNELMESFQPSTNLDLRHLINEEEDNLEEVCHGTKIHPLGLEGVFNNFHLMSKSTEAGFMEPLLPVFRSQKICDSIGEHLMSMKYLVHDFYSMCKSLKRTTRTVFVDMGASLDFHGDAESPAIYINRIYSRFGFKFDHIYAYEITQKNPVAVYESVPNDLMDSYHWINVAVDAEPGGKMNPFTTLLDHFEPDDFVVVKLDIDTPSIESQLAQQLRNTSKLLEIVNVFYFEDHRKQLELQPYWGNSAQGSVVDSLVLMAEMREKGVASHYWP